jgi:formyltetrahydrofolate hydrolase
MTVITALEQSRTGLVTRISTAIRKQDLNQRAEQNYLHWINRFVLFHDCEDPETMDGEDCEAFLNYLEERMGASRAKLNQARQALTFFFEDVLGKRDIGTTAAA